LKDKEERRRGRRTQQIEEEWCVALVSLEASLFFSFFFWFPSYGGLFVVGIILVILGQGSSPFQMKWRVSISWSRLNILDLTIYRVPRHLKF
jgi:hypothetical protein